MPGHSRNEAAATDAATRRDPGGELAARAPLLACQAFGPALSATRAAAAIGKGLRAGGCAQTDLCPLEPAAEGAEEITRLLAGVHFDARMRGARAVILACPQLRRERLPGSLAFEIATRARQGGVPAYALALQSWLDAFDARMLDLQVILCASSATVPGLTAAARRLAALL